MHQIAPPAWLAERAMYRFSSLTPATTALIVVDMQVIFTEPGQPASGPYADEIIPAINQVAAAVRAKGGMVVFTRHTMTREGPRAVKDWQVHQTLLGALEPQFQLGRREHGLDPRMDVRRGDRVIDKYRYSALTHHSSDLNMILEEAGIETVIVTGVVTNGCCESTARDASMLGYKTFFLSDATAAMSDEEHVSALTSIGAAFGDLRTAEQMIELVQRS